MKCSHFLRDDVSVILCQCNCCPVFLELYLTLTLLLLPQSISKLKLVVFESPKKPSNFFGPCLLLSSPGCEENLLSFQNLHKPPSGAMGIVYFRCEPDILKKKKEMRTPYLQSASLVKFQALTKLLLRLVTNTVKKGIGKKKFSSNIFQD